MKERPGADIRFWLLLFFLIRLTGITDPPLEIAHNWRQVTGHMIARNFYEVDNNILYPRLDIAGAKTGITGTEFPLMNYLEYLLSLVFGFHDWFGRLINLLVSSIGIYYFYKLLRLRFEERFSFHAAFLLLFSSWLMFSRKAMPDTFCTSLVIISLYHAFRYCSEGKGFNALWFFLFGTAGVLIKIPAIYLLIVLVFPLADREVAAGRKMILVLCGSLMLVPVFWWYFQWVPALNEQFGFRHYFMGTTFGNGFREIRSNLLPTFEKFYFDALKFSGFLLFLSGLVLAILRKEKRVLLTTLFCSIVFAVFMLKSGRNFYHHSYYIVPFVPVMALVAAYALEFISRPFLRNLILFVFVAESIAAQQHDFYIKDSEKYKSGMEVMADSFSERNDLFVLNTADNPQQMYLLHRRGWLAWPGDIERAGFVDSLESLGCRYLLVNRHYGSPPSIHKFRGKEVFSDRNFVVYSLSHKRP